MTYQFHYYNSLAETGIFMALNEFLREEKEPPVVLCIGSDLAVGDSLGPIVGTQIKKKGKDAYLYGTLRTPVTAKEIRGLNEFLKKTHPDRKIVAIDAALGEEEEVGLITVSNHALMPGAGAKKKLGKIGDVCILGIVGRKEKFCYSNLNLTRLNMVWCMSEIISEGVYSFLCNKSDAKCNG